MISGRWEAINSDLLAIEDLINEEETTVIEIIATLDNEQILERWQELGDIGTFEGSNLSRIFHEMSIY